MAYTILVLTDNALTPHDVNRLAQWREPEPTAVHILVAEHGSGLVESIDDIALGHRPSEDENEEKDPSQVAAADTLTSVDALRAAGIEATGAVVPSDPVDAATDAAQQVGADEVWVLTEPHMLEDAFRRDWASRLRRSLQLPVLHAVSGTDQIVS